MKSKIIKSIICLTIIVMSSGCICNNHSNNSKYESVILDISIVSEAEIRELSLNSEKGDRVFFGTYNQNGVLSNNEPIIWRILDKSEGTIFMLSEYCIDCLPFHSEDVKGITWESSTLRKWLNNDFYQSAFSNDEKLKISKEKTLNEMNPEFSIGGGANTFDSVFLLSIAEVKSFFSSDNERRSKATEYAIEKGVYVYKNNLCDWWLRSTGGYEFTAVTIGSNGTIFTMGNPVFSYDKGIRPAIKVKLSQD